MSEYAPRITTIMIDKDKIREIIGPGGKVVRDIQEPPHNHLHRRRRSVQVARPTSSSATALAGSGASSPSPSLRITTQK